VGGLLATRESDDVLGGVSLYIQERNNVGVDPFRLIPRERGFVVDVAQQRNWYRELGIAPEDGSVHVTSNPAGERRNTLDTSSMRREVEFWHAHAIGFTVVVKIAEVRQVLGDLVRELEFIETCVRVEEPLRLGPERETIHLVNGKNSVPPGQSAVVTEQRSGEVFEDLAIDSRGIAVHSIDETKESNSIWLELKKRDPLRHWLDVRETPTSDRDSSGDHCRLLR